MKPTLRQLQYLVAIADTGRFGEAAQRLNVTQPGLSAQIKDMEIELGAPLLERGRHGAFLTPVGSEVVQRARTILNDVQELVSVAQQRGDVLSGRLAIGVLPSIGAYFLPVATRRLHMLYPDLRLNVQEGSSADLARRLQAGELEMIISTPGDVGDATMLPLFQESLWICAAQDDALSAARSPIKLKALKGRALLSLGSGHRLSQIIESLAIQADAHVSAEYQGTSLDAVRQMAVMGAGVAVLPSLYALGEAIRDPDFVVRRIDHPAAVHDIALFWRRASPSVAHYENFGRHLIEIKRDIPDDLPA